MDKKTERTLVANSWLILLLMLLCGWNAVQNWRLQDEYTEFLAATKELRNTTLSAPQGSK